MIGKIAKFLVFTAFLAVFAVSSPVLAQDEKGKPMFFQTLNDVPLMPGLYEIVEESVVFDMPEGRIAESKAISESLGKAAIHNFYEATLPQLGWQKVSRDAFVRENEKLMMAIEPLEAGNLVSISVQPR